MTITPRLIKIVVSLSFICDNTLSDVSYKKMQKTKDVKFFVDKDKKNHAASWLNKFDIKTRSRINLRLVRLEYSSYGNYKSSSNKLFELRFFVYERLQSVFP